ncbi:MAG TPA: sugar transferase [Terracidiphilus sp.]|nr:sugar transferase [Terracidiphilus sp.]
MNTGRQGRPVSLNDPLSEPAVERRALDEESFRRVIAIERKRTERSKAPFVLMLVEVANQSSAKSAPALETVMAALLASSRDTDVVGWYKGASTIGAVFTGLVSGEKSAILMTILTRATSTLREELSFEQFNLISISLHYYPDDWDENGPGRPSNPALYPDLSKQASNKQPMLVLKRTIDIVGSLILIAVFFPFCVLIALVIKLTSKGPILFRQMRVGQHGRQFEFLKFRSMYAQNDARVHQEYVTKLIRKGAPAEETQGNVYKLTGDKRITPVGRFLRKTSLDELPQFINVLLGDMSLVGPRPPIPYELAAYQTWHRRRLLEVKPGITGLWQVTGRSTVDFDAMVRLDLKYATSWSPLLDLKILLRTPLAVIRGSGAY